MLEHAIPGQLLEWSTGEVGGIAHEQQVRKVVGAQLPNCIFCDGQGFVVGLKCTAFVHRADLDSNPLCIDFTQDRFDNLEEKARAIFQAPAVFVFTQVGGSVQKLRDQIEIVGEDLDTIEAGFHRVSRCSREVRNRDLNFLLRQRPRCYRGLPSRRRDRNLAWVDIRCGHWLRAAQQFRMRDCAGMPELCNDAAASRMDGIRDASPSADLLPRPKAWRISPAKSIRANRSGLRDDQSGRSTLRVIPRLQGRGYMIMRLRTHPGERRHDNTVRKIEVSHPIWCEKRLTRHHMNPWLG
jgi:hypothetical protein